MTEQGQLILDWLQGEYPKLGWHAAHATSRDNAPVEHLEANLPDALGGTRGLVIVLEIYKLSVTAFMRTRHLSRVRSVELHDPNSIDGLKELVDHVIKVCSLPSVFTKYT